MVSDAQKRASAKYNKDNYLTVALRMREDVAKDFLAFAEKHGLSNSQAALVMVTMFLGKKEKGFIERCKFLFK